MIKTDYIMNNHKINNLQINTLHCYVNLRNNSVCLILLVSISECVHILNVASKLEHLTSIIDSFLKVHLSE